MKYLILLFLITGCGKNLEDFIRMGKPALKKAKTDPIFAPFVNSFQEEFNLRVKVPIVFKTIEKRYAGVCLVYSNGYREININKDLWAYYSYEQREQLIYHELGHCVFNKGHDNTTREDCPHSIMRSYMFSNYEINECYLPQYNHYMDNLGS
jgi:hypothetical protein